MLLTFFYLKYDNMDKKFIKKKFKNYKINKNKLLLMKLQNSHCINK